ncbi:MAG TPA: acetyl-CoA carboxylase, carboxyltransferase subunit beta [Candidatus Methylacidiphilales bacterium]|jgi:acetyl-CoA carboxylase carboxyl transferase subunit beta|nr:acetyl-CoA carboxylase, carboxyltransferase subunit beta [Candidatus Methylacidiphilales bacterium]
MSNPLTSSGSFFPKPDYGKTPSRKKEMPEGLWTKCPGCSAYVFNKELESLQMVCKECGHHFNITAHQRLQHLLDEGSWQEFDAGVSSVDVLKFTGATSYSDQLKKYQKKTGLKEGVVAGLGKIEGHAISVAVMEFNFLGGSMGSVMGEKITRAIERATEGGLPVLIFSASGGARMHEGMFSLMQMAKTSGALSRHAAARLPYISILTHPTMGGVTASFATLGDFNIAEPKAMIGFAGARVLKETTRQDLPKGFQTAEFLLERGLIDRIVSRLEMRAELAKLLDYLGQRAASRKGHDSHRKGHAPHSRPQEPHAVHHNGHAHKHAA